MVRIGVLAVQGAFQEHQATLEALLEAEDPAGEVVQVRRAEQAERCDGFVLPGGESTTIEKLLDSSGLRPVLTEAIEAGAPAMATCAGAILIASEGDEQVERTETQLLGLLDAEIERNAFGRQRESFEAEVDVEALGEAPFPGVFIRAPAFKRTWGQARPFARLPRNPHDPDGREVPRLVGVEQGNILALTFHPELSGDPRIHRHFLDRVFERA